MKSAQKRAEQRAKIEDQPFYAVSDAVKLMKELSQTKFDASAEIHFTLGVDPRHADQQVRGTVVLPHGTGKVPRIIVFCEDGQVKAAKAAGADHAGNEELLQKVAGGWLEFDTVIATPELMKSLAKVARVLGPKGLMPNPKVGTVTPNPEAVIQEIKSGRVEFKNDKGALIHGIFGKLSFSAENLTANLESFIQAVKESKPSGAKGEYLKKITINSTMGLGIPVQIN